MVGGTTTRVLRALAHSFLAGEATAEEIVGRCSRALGVAPAWLKPLAVRYVETFAGRTRPRFRNVVEFVRADQGLAEYKQPLQVREWLHEASRMQPAVAAQAWKVPVIETVGALADWFWMEPWQLEWYADLAGLSARAEEEPLRHYRVRLLEKRSGGVRVIEMPKRRLKRMQRQILEWIVNRIPPHEAAHGFRQGRWIGSFASPHVGRPVVLRMDLANFFPSVHGARVQARFRTAGYPEPVADLLGGLCTSVVPRSGVYERPHLPQGAPTSPALANLCAYRLDCRLAGLAAAAGLVYTRYADDLAFSGDRITDRFATHVAAIAMEEGFDVQHRKTRVMRQGVRQHLVGLVVNERINVDRAEFDRLKAILTNCARHGPTEQNREGHSAFRAHLEGRVQFVLAVNPQRGERLRRIFDEIRWD